MGALFGTLSALFIGFSDLFGRRVVRASSALTAAVAVQMVAIVASLVCVAGFGGTFERRDLVLGLVSGLGLGVGLGTYYGGIARSSSTVVSPLVAALSSLIPFVYAVIKGASPTVYAVVGAVVAVGGIALITVGGGSATHIRTGLAWGTISGIAYGVGFVLVIDTSADAGSWPAVWQRVAAATLLVVVAVRAGAPVLPPAGARAWGVLGGVFTGLCTVAYLAGVRADPTAAVITSSMFPAASVGIGRIVFHDSVSRLQAMGLVIALVGVIGVVAG